MLKIILEDLIGSELGLYDNRSDDEKSVHAYKAVDITEFFPDEKQVVVKYADVTRGKIAQLCFWYRKNVDMGMTIHYHINEYTPTELSSDSVFKAHMPEGKSLEIARFIIDNA